MGTARIDIAYEGTGFAGWAAQPGLRTVQGELESGLERILGQRVELTVAGRTDAGVHAAGQVASFEHGAELPDRLAERLNAVLADDLAVRAAGPAADGFDARRQARSRCYRYRLLASPIRDPFERHRALATPSTAACSTSALTRRSEPTTSPPSRRPSPSTCFSSARCCAPSGGLSIMPGLTSPAAETKRRNRATECWYSRSKRRASCAIRSG